MNKDWHTARWKGLLEFHHMQNRSGMKEIFTIWLNISRICFIVDCCYIILFLIVLTVLKRTRKSKNDLINAEEGGDHFTDISSVGEYDIYHTLPVPHTVQQVSKLSILQTQTAVQTEDCLVDRVFFHYRFTMYAFTWVRIPQQRELSRLWVWTGIGFHWQFMVLHIMLIGLPLQVRYSVSTKQMYTIINKSKNSLIVLDPTYSSFYLCIIVLSTPIFSTFDKQLTCFFVLLPFFKSIKM